MPIDPTKLANLLALQKPSVCAYWKVEWDANDSNQDRYYSNAVYNEMTPYTGVGVAIEARILEDVVNSTTFEINPDLRTETIPLTFDDIDKTISGKFQTFKSGVRCELFFYYPDVDLTVSVWFGQLQAPDVYGHKTLKTKATNGFRSREQKIPRRMRPKECTSNFGAYMSSMFASETNLCPVNIHLPGGTVGVPGETDCPRDSVTTCDGKVTGEIFSGAYYGGFRTDAVNTVTSPNPGGVSVSKGNASSLKEPVRVIAGTKQVRGNNLLLWRREFGAPDINHNWVATVWEVCEGPVSSIYNVVVNEKLIEPIHLNIKSGARNQNRTSYAADVSNFSATAHLFARYGWVNPNNITPANLSMECSVIGYSQVAVFTDATTYTRIWTDSRAWWLMELYTNQRFGMANDWTRFEIDDFITADEWTREAVQFTARFPDGELKHFGGRRTQFDCILEGRPVAEQIEDICRAGALSVPFQHEGKYTVTPFRIATGGELSAAKVFTDTGENKNIIWKDGQPAINLAQTPDDKLVNEIEITFEDASKGDIERPVTIDDPNQKLKAGRALGDANLQSVPKRFGAFGVRNLQEAVRLGYRLLRFGEFDEGGVQNNLRATFTTPFEQSLGVRRYDVIKVVSSLLANFEIGTNDGVNDWVETPQYFRVLKLKKIQGGLVEIVAQAYNQTAYEDFETTSGGGGGSCTLDTDCPPGYICQGGVCILATGGGVCSVDADCPPGFVCRNGICVPIVDPDPCPLTFGAVTYDDVNGLLVVPIDPC